MYDESSDRRRKVSERRTADRLAQSRGIFRNLLETLRFGNHAQVDRVLRAVRYDASLKDIVTTILETRQDVHLLDPTRALLLSELDELPSKDSPSPIPDRIGPFTRTLSLQELCSNCPFNVCSQGWTNVGDEKVVCLLICVYLTWDHGFMRITDEEAFLADMANGMSEFCSPLLVNVMCAFTSGVC